MTTSTLSNDNGEANDASYDKYIKVPLDIDNNPIRYDGNPAHILGCLHEYNMWVQRTGNFKSLLEDGAVLLSNGKLAVDNLNAVLLVTGVNKDPDGGYSFEKPCPGTEIRINAYDADATAKSTAKFSRITSVPAAMSDQFIVSKYTVVKEDNALANSLLSMIEDSDEKNQLAQDCAGEGRKLIAMLYDIDKLARPEDRALVKAELQSFIDTGIVGEITLQSFNLFYKGYCKLNRRVPPAARQSTEAEMTMLHSKLMRDSVLRDKYDLQLSIHKPTDTAAVVKIIRDMLRSRKVYSQIDDLALPNVQPALVTDLSNRQVKALAAMGIDASKMTVKELAGAMLAKQQEALAADPRKTRGGGANPAKNNPNGGPRNEWPRDEHGNLTHWVQGMGLCGCDSADGGRHPRWKCPKQKWKGTPQGTKKGPPDNGTVEQKGLIAQASTPDPAPADGHALHADLAACTTQGELTSALLAFFTDAEPAQVISDDRDELHQSLIAQDVQCAQCDDPEAPPAPAEQHPQQPVTDISADSDVQVARATGTVPGGSSRLPWYLYCSAAIIFAIVALAFVPYALGTIPSHYTVNSGGPSAIGAMGGALDGMPFCPSGHGANPGQQDALVAMVFRDDSAVVAKFQPFKVLVTFVTVMALVALWWPALVVSAAALSPLDFLSATLYALAIPTIGLLNCVGGRAAAIVGAIPVNSISRSLTRLHRRLPWTVAAILLASAFFIGCTRSPSARSAALDSFAAARDDPSTGPAGSLLRSVRHIPIDYRGEWHATTAGTLIGNTSYQQEALVDAAEEAATDANAMGLPVFYAHPDSGCTGSVTNECARLTNLRACDEVYGQANGHMSHCEAIGDLPVYARDSSGAVVSFVLTNVRCVPSFKYTLLSVRQMWAEQRIDARFRDLERLELPNGKGNIPYDSAKRLYTITLVSKVMAEARLANSGHSDGRVPISAAPPAAKRQCIQRAFVGFHAPTATSHIEKMSAAQSCRAPRRMSTSASALTSSHGGASESDGVMT